MFVVIFYSRRAELDGYPLLSNSIKNYYREMTIFFIYYILEYLYLSLYSYHYRYDILNCHNSLIGYTYYALLQTFQQFANNQVDIKRYKGMVIVQIHDLLEDTV